MKTPSKNKLKLLVCFIVAFLFYEFVFVGRPSSGVEVYYQLLGEPPAGVRIISGYKSGNWESSYAIKVEGGKEAFSPIIQKLHLEPDKSSYFYTTWEETVSRRFGKEDVAFISTNYSECDFLSGQRLGVSYWVILVKSNMYIFAQRP